MKRNNYINSVLLMILLYSTFFTASIYKSDFWGNILSPVIDAITSAVLLQNLLLLNKDEKSNSRKIWINLYFSMLSWTVADLIWSFYYFFTPFSPGKSILLKYLYFIPNMFILAAVILYFMDIYRKWNMLQLTLDSLSITLSSMLLVWMVFYKGDLQIVKLLFQQHMFENTMLTFDIAALVIMFISYYSIRQGKLNNHTYLVLTGILVYYTADIYYLYLCMHDLYVPNTLIDSVYMLGFLFIAIGSITKNHWDSSPRQQMEKLMNVGFRQKRLILMLFPIIALFFGNFGIQTAAYFLIILAIREMFTVHIQRYIKKEQQLAAEKEMNLLLEEKIIQRTKEISDAYMKLEMKNKELDFLSNMDHLTNLYNRRYFFSNLDSKLLSLDNDEKTALFYIDLDRFKFINDMYGHQIGDQALVEIARRLKMHVCGDSILARMGGDEFVLVKRGFFEYEDMEALARSMVKECNEPIEIGQYLFYVSVSIGISIYPLDAKDSYSLMRNADFAMHEIKENGKNGFIFFDSRISEKMGRKIKIENLIKTADYSKEFELYYQPQFSIGSREIIGAEALLRWKNRELGILSPTEFISIAEEMDCISSIGDWVMKKAIMQIAQWNKKSLYVKVGINVSPKQLDNKNFIDRLTFIMNENHVAPEQIDIEITENQAIAGEYRIKQIDSLLSGLGVSVSIDDFGTGYSSLSYLKILPFERIKIAKQLIDVISSDSFDYEIVKAVIMLAKSIGIRTIAEGVENHEQLDILTKLGCDEFQGYLYGKPMAAEDFEAMILIQSAR